MKNDICLKYRQPVWRCSCHKLSGFVKICNNTTFRRKFSKLLMTFGLLDLIWLNWWWADSRTLDLKDLVWRGGDSAQFHRKPPLMTGQKKISTDAFSPPSLYESWGGWCLTCPDTTSPQFSIDSAQFACRRLRELGIKLLFFRLIALWVSSEWVLLYFYKSVSVIRVLCNEHDICTIRHGLAQKRSFLTELHLQVYCPAEMTRV